MSLNMKQKHFLQSDDWGAVQTGFGKKVIKRQGTDWSYQALIGPNPGRIGKYIKCVFIPYGPSFNSPEGLKMALEDILQLATAEKADQIVVEPYSLSDQTDISAVMNGYKKLVKSRQPELTLVTDLTKPWDEILQSMSKTNRYQWKYLDRDGISFSRHYDPKEVDDFAAMMQSTAKRTGAHFPAAGYYRHILQTLGPAKKAGLLYGYHNGQKLVGTLFIDDYDAKRRYYLYAGSYDEMRNVKAALNAALVMYLQKDAKDQGMQSLDYFGVAPVDAPKDHPWYGLSKFKRSLGGEDFATLGTWEKNLKKNKVAFIKFIQRII
jgi:lipid II:glycine glycyltransferase (peptidoglycan interpeptide bridge formation enzyme)